VNTLVIWSRSGPLALIGDIGGGELLLVMSAVLMLFGSKRLPAIARSLGKTLEDLRRASQDFRSQLMNADREVTDTLEEPLQYPRQFKPNIIPARTVEAPAPPLAGTSPAPPEGGQAPVPDAVQPHDSAASAGAAPAPAYKPASQEIPPRDLAG
jgi:sec-independent protein translocase protein TatA